MEEHDADVGVVGTIGGEMIDLEPVPQNKDELLKYYRDRIGTAMQISYRETSLQLFKLFVPLARAIQW